AKERLSFEERAEITIGSLSASFTQKNLEEMLDRNEFFTQIEQTLRRALNAARERGYEEEQVKAVLMVGGSSLMPQVQRFVQRLFGRGRVLLQRPRDAGGRGAAGFVAGVELYDHIQRGYAIAHFE